MSSYGENEVIMTLSRVMRLFIVDELLYLCTVAKKKKRIWLIVIPDKLPGNMCCQHVLSEHCDGRRWRFQMMLENLSERLIKQISSDCTNELFEIINGLNNFFK